MVWIFFIHIQRTEWNERPSSTLWDWVDCDCQAKSNFEAHNHKATIISPLTGAWSSDASFISWHASRCRPSHTFPRRVRQGLGGLKSGTNLTWHGREIPLTHHGSPKDFWNYHGSRCNSSLGEPNQTGPFFSTWPTTWPSGTQDRRAVARTAPEARCEGGEKGPKMCCLRLRSLKKWW